MMNDLILFGPPGAGKGTQGALLAERLGCCGCPRATCCGTRCGAARPWALEARRYMDAGELVPDEVILGIVRDYLAARLRSAASSSTASPHHAAGGGLDALLGELGRPLDAVLVLEVDGRRAGQAAERAPLVQPVRRRLQRLLRAAARGRPLRPCGGELVLRPDDEPATVRRRLEVYQEQTAPLLEHYEARRAVHHARRRPAGGRRAGGPGRSGARAVIASRRRGRSRPSAGPAGSSALFRELSGRSGRA
jgi:adenylate kinase